MMRSLTASVCLCCYLLSFFLCVCHDIWKKTVPVSLFFILLLCGIPTFCFRIFSVSDPFSVQAIVRLMLSFAPGLGLMILSLFTGEMIGMGDGYFLLLSGCFISWLPLLLILGLGFMTAGILSIGILSYGKWRGKSMRNFSIPFLPCLIPALPILLRAFPSI